ncbi:MAG: alkaline phosphatase family protein [Chloroflexi bacterium]|nr:alkaline phosphatase family protein [Chloroflexota bacterium]
MDRPERIVILDIDGLRRDVYEHMLGKLPNLSRLFSNGVHLPVLSTAPSITFAAQAALFTGEHPSATLIPGNDCFDRIGNPLIDDGHPRHYGFTVGDTKAYDDAVQVFAGGLVDRVLSSDIETLYETASAQGKTSIAAHHMITRGATKALMPNLVDIARFTKGKGIFGMGDGAYDDKMLDRLAGAFDEFGGLPDITTAYFMGVDHHSHAHGPDAQAGYLRDYIDPQVGRLLEMLEQHGSLGSTLFVMVSDHGHLATPGDDAHSIRLGFPFDMELSPLFHALGLDLHDLPGEDPAVDAVMGLNGGLALAYLRHREEDWPVPPRYEDDVLRVADAFHAMNTTGKYREELKDTLELILVRDCERDGWRAPFRVYLSDGETQSLDEWLADHPDLPYVDAMNRLMWAASHMTGDMILCARAAEGVYFGADGLRGVHGSLHKGDSEAVMGFALPGSDHVELGEQVRALVKARCADEGDRQPSIADMAYIIREVFLSAEQ